MENGIITRSGKFISCEYRRHIATANQYDTSNQFLLISRYQHEIDIIGELNNKMKESLFDYITKYNVILEEVATIYLMEQL